MDITQFIKYLNKAKGWGIQGAYYTRIDEWRRWWKGDQPAFHAIKRLGWTAVSTPGGCTAWMPKKACEDWASLLLNDKTTVTVADKSL